MGVMAGTPRTTAGYALALGGAASSCGVVAAALAVRVAALAPHAATAQAPELVELGVLAAGVLVLAWLAASAALAAACLAVRGAGSTWRRGEACVHRFAPAVVRRALVVVVAAGLGAGTVTGACAVDLPPTSPADVTAVAGDVDIDLGWVVTGDGGPSRATAVPAPGAATTAAPAATSTGPTASARTTPSSIPAPGPTADPATPGPAVGDVPTFGGEGTPRTTPALDGVRVTTTPQAPDTAGAAAPAPAHDLAASAPVQDALRVPATSRWVPAGSAAGAAVTVAPGDTLWAITARHLPAGATDAQVAAAWPAWYAANAATIGPEPDLILPGQLLQVPGQVAP